MATTQQRTNGVGTQGSDDSGGLRQRRRYARHAMQLGGVVSGLGSGLLWTSWTVAKCIGALALLLGLFQLLNSILRIRLDHWGSDALRGHLVREFLIGGAAMFALALGGLLVPPSLFVLLCMSAWLVVAALAYSVVEEAVWDTVEAEELEHCTSFVARQHPFRPLGGEKSLGEWAVAPGRGPIQAFVSKLLEWPAVGKLSTTRSYITALMAAMSLLTTTCAIGVGAAIVAGYHPHAAGPVDDRAPVRGRDPVVEQGKPGTSRSRQTTQRRGPADTWERRCDWLPGARPEDAGRVTGEERAMLHGLYLGGVHESVDDPPGATAGCTGRAHVSRKTETRFVHVVGRDRGGRILSVATVSRQFGPAIFLGAAAKPALELIERFRDIGGTRRMDAGGGQLYGVATPLGTAVLVRATIWSAGDPSREAPFATLPPAAATLWLAAMREFGVWLWPLPRLARDAIPRLRLVANLASNRRLAEVVVNPMTRTARIVGQASVTGPFGYVIGDEELRWWADKAP